MHIFAINNMMALIIFANMLSVTVALPLSLETDKLALLSLKEKLTNGVPDSLPSWNDSLHVCKWQGVICSPRHMRVSVLYLENQYYLGGTLGPALGNLTFLRELNLTNINLHGEIPREVGRLKRLHHLDLSNNSIHGELPIELTNCTNLQRLLILNNKLTGKVPSWLGSMMQLTWLVLGRNNLVGTIPPSLGNLSSLEKLSVGANHLEGYIPHALGRLTKLKKLSLTSNNLSGLVPHSLYNLSNIQVFVLAYNHLFGTLPSNIHLAFPNLEYFHLGTNRFTGTFPTSISNLSGLQTFDISENGFSGPIPSSLGRLYKLRIFDIGSNSFGNASAHDCDFLSSLTNCTQLQYLWMDINNLGGILPHVIGNLTANLYHIGMSKNQISGRIPDGIGQLIGLAILHMGSNFLEGTIPDSFGKLKNLGRLVLEVNRLSGNIPAAIGNLTMLSELYLGGNKFEGNIPFTLKYCTKLQIFGAPENNLSGNIPNHTFGYQEGLIVLDLSYNSLAGPIPSQLGNSDHLSMLYLNDNKLFGEIPRELGTCTQLTELNLGRNLLQGNIPSFLGSLRSLETLDLSHNNFSSTIPPELENLTLLTTLNLSFNHLYGKVPIGGVFNNITVISLSGNKYLCGGIPQLKLPACSKLPSKKHKRSIKKEVILIMVIGGILISIIICIGVYYLRRMLKKQSSSPSLQNGYIRVSYGELHQATNGFSSSTLVGSGSFGSVYRGTLVHFEMPIAVKVLNLQTRGASKSFLAECRALGKLKHRNLLKIITSCSGVDYKGEDFKAIVFELMPNGSLESLLHSNLSLNISQRLNIALDVAQALDYLHHDSGEEVVHCDIKPSNVLLDDDMVAHLGDFGLARLLHGTMDYSSGGQASSSAIKGTIGYVPPEYGAGHSVSPQGDIYSYGILLLEMLTRKKPTDSMFGEGLSLPKFCDMAIPEGITEIVDSSCFPIPFAEDKKIKECLVSFAKIGVACSAEFPAHRMHIKDVIMQLHAIKQKLQI